MKYETGKQITAHFPMGKVSGRITGTDIVDHLVYFQDRDGKSWEVDTKRIRVTAKEEKDGKYAV